ncbi:MAG: hypothetical protein CMG25_05425, partial [Candidatus Marinimicrobia bacterium]|nr:hypothetical protein [Candidatus Neomarinimicrobiota bacterium]
MFKKSILFLQFILLFTFTFSQDVVLSLDGTSLNYSSSEDIGGFQFSHNGCVTNASGGDAASNGFAISSSGTAVIAFSFTGAVIPAGEGILVELTGDISQDCLFDYVFSDAGGNGLDVLFEEASSDDGADEESFCPDGTQVCLSLDGTSLNYSSSEDIGGFQFS